MLKLVSDKGEVNKKEGYGRKENEQIWQTFAKAMDNTLCNCGCDCLRRHILPVLPPNYEYVQPLDGTTFVTILISTRNIEDI